MEARGESTSVFGHWESTKGRGARRRSWVQDSTLIWRQVTKYDISLFNSAFYAQMTQVILSLGGFVNLKHVYPTFQKFKKASST